MENTLDILEKRIRNSKELLRMDWSELSQKITFYNELYGVLRRNC
jgi:hypothetical protein